MENLLGIMQGRLLPKHNGHFQAHPVGIWEKEFEIANIVGLDCIEFILDFDQFEINPLLTEKGVQDILEKVNQYQVQVVSVCADFFMTNPIFLEDQKSKDLNFSTLKMLINNSKKIGVTDIVIPLVDGSSIKDDFRKQDSTIEFLEDAIKIIDNDKQKLCLETDLLPHRFLNFVNRLNSEKVKINYDIGNSASLGYDFREEFEVYGNLVTNIHIKDRLYNGGSVHLGRGNAKLVDFFKFLKKCNYKGIFIMQAYREDDDGLSSFLPQYDFIKNVICEHFL